MVVWSALTLAEPSRRRLLLSLTTSFFPAVGRSWTGALSPPSLEHARARWLLPLRHVAAQAAAVAQQERPAGGEAARGPPAQPAEEGPSDRSREWREEAAVDMVREVLHRVLELVEDALRQGAPGETQPG